VLDQIGPNGEISLATAEQAYMLAFGPLPGVPTPPKPSGLLPSATLAVSMIVQHYANLTAAQQQVVLQRLGFTAPASSQTAPPATALAAPLAPPRPTTRTLAMPAQSVLPPPPVPTDVPGTATYRTMLTGLTPKLNGYLAYTLALPITLAFDPATTAEAYTDGVDATGSFGGPPVYCRISLNPEVNTYPPDRQLLVMAHELTHCYEFAIQGLAAITYASPAWLNEGSAAWSGAVASGVTDTNPEMQAFWAGWLELEHPDHPLFARTYSAVGFFSLLNQAGISPWSVLPAMFKSQTHGKVPDNLAAYHAGTVSQEMLNQWASSDEREPALGAAWDLTGPAILPVGTYGQLADQQVSIGNGQLVKVATPAYTAALYNSVSTADVLQVQISGTSRLKDGDGVERVPSANGNYCTKPGGCTCPPGSNYAGPTPTPLQQNPRLYLALTGGEQGSSGVILGETLQQFCAKTTSVLPITQALCRQILSIDEANAIMQPAAPATSIVAANIAQEASCSYLASPGRYVLTILFAPFPPGTSVNAFVQDALAKAAQAQAHWTIAITPVSGVGDQAIYVSATAALNGLTYYWVGLVTTVGQIAIACDTIGFGSAAPPLQAPLTQCAQVVVSRLDP
jgi:hypothetical protein